MSEHKQRFCFSYYVTINLLWRHESLISNLKMISLTVDEYIKIAKEQYSYNLDQVNQFETFQVQN